MTAVSISMSCYKHLQLEVLECLIKLLLPLDNGTDDIFPLLLMYPWVPHTSFHNDSVTGLILQHHNAL